MLWNKIANDRFVFFLSILFYCQTKFTSRLTSKFDCLHKQLIYRLSNLMYVSYGTLTFAMARIFRFPSA